MNSTILQGESRFARTLYFLVVLPPAWLFSHMTQVVWIHQECGTPDLMRERARICGDNAIRLQWGGVLGCLLLISVLLLLRATFRAYGQQFSARVMRKTAFCFQTLFFSAVAFWPPLRSDKTLAAVVFLFVTSLSFLLRHEISMLFYSNATKISGNENSDRFIDVFLFLALGVQIILAFVGFSHPILDHFSWRQTQTAISTYYLVEEGFRLDYITPLFGKPWSIPMEFPLYQYCSAAIVRLTGMDVESSSRLVSLAAYYGCILVLRRLLNRLGFSRMVVRLCLALALLCPLYIFYARAVLIETLATMLGLISVMAAVQFFQSRSWISLLLLLFSAILCSLTKITTFVVSSCFMAGIFIFFLRTPFTANLKPGIIVRYFLATMAGVGVPLLIGLFWVRYTDRIKMLNPIIGDMWTSAALKTWNFGTLEQRFTIDFWQQILISRMRDVFGHLAPLILLVMLVIVFRRNARANYWSRLGIITFFSGPLIFSNLYYVHDYYFVANGFFLLLSLGIVLGRAYESAEGLTLRNYRILILVPVGLSFLSWYIDKYLPKQVRKNYEAVAVGNRVQEITGKDDVIIVHGDIAHPDIPYYARRKTLINEADNRDFEGKKMQQALTLLENESIGAVLIPLTIPDNERSVLIGKYAQRYAFKRIPAAVVENVEIYTR